MEKCKDCIRYNSSSRYKGVGWCDLYDSTVDENHDCEIFNDEYDEYDDYVR